MKTIVLNEVQRQSVLFLLGGKHQTQLEPFQKEALDEVEAQLRAVPTESESVVAPDQSGTVSSVAETPAAPVAKAKRARGRK